MEPSESTIPRELAAELEGATSGGAGGGVGAEGGGITAAKFIVSVPAATIFGCGLIIFNTQSGEISRVVIHLGPDRELSRLDLGSSVKAFEADILEKQFNQKGIAHLINAVSESLYEAMNTPGSHLRTAMLRLMEDDVRRCLVQEIDSRIEEGDIHLECRVESVDPSSLSQEPSVEGGAGASATEEARTVVIDIKPIVSPVKGVTAGMLSAGCILVVTLINEKDYFTYFPSRGIEPGAGIQTRVISIEPGSTGRTRIVTNLGDGMLGAMQVNPDIRIRAMKADGTEFPLRKLSAPESSMFGLDPATAVPTIVLLFLVGFLVAVAMYLLG